MTACETSTLTTSPCTVGRTLLLHGRTIMRNDGRGDSDILLKESVPQVETAAQWFFLLRSEHRTAIVRARFPDHKVQN